MPLRLDRRLGLLALLCCAQLAPALAGETIVIREVPDKRLAAKPLTHQSRRTTNAESAAEVVAMRQSPAASENAPQVDLAVKPLAALSIGIAPPGGGSLPPDRSVPVDAEGPESLVAEYPTDRTWEPWNYSWEASALCHKPLYFEQPNVERYGHYAPILQPAFSAAHFFCTIPILPYKMTQNPPNEIQYTLGYYRPGDPARWERTDVRWDPKAAAVQGGVVTGLIFVLP